MKIPIKEIPNTPKDFTHKTKFRVMERETNRPRPVYGWLVFNKSGNIVTYDRGYNVPFLPLFIAKLFSNTHDKYYLEFKTTDVLLTDQEYSILTNLLSLSNNANSQNIHGVFTLIKSSDSEYLAVRGPSGAMDDLIVNIRVGADSFKQLRVDTKYKFEIGNQTLEEITDTEVSNTTVKEIL